MAQDKSTLTNIDKSNLAAYPDGQIQDNDGTNNGTPVARFTQSDQYEFFAKLMRLAGLTFNNQYDNETNGFQYIAALQTLANKNDLIQPLSAVTEVIGGVSTQVLKLANLKIEKLQVGEIIIAQPGADYASQTTIEGSTTGVYAAVTSSAYKANNYLIIVNGSGGFTIQTIATSSSLDLMVTALSYLKAASNADTVTGTSVTGAVTPASFLYAFTKFVTDPTLSAPYLASDSTPGLLSAADKTAIDTSLTTKKIGWLSGVDPGGGTVGSTYPVSGNITTATVVSNFTGGYYSVAGQPIGNGTLILITLDGAILDHSGTATESYFVRTFSESIGSSLSTDSIAWNITFKVISPTQFQIAIREGYNAVENLKIHCEVVLIS